MSWIDDLAGYKDIEGASGVAATRRSIVRFVGATVTDDGTRTLVQIPQTPTQASGFSLLAKPDTGTGTAQSLTLGTNQLPLRGAGNVVAQSVGTNELVARAGGALGTVGVPAQSIPLRGAGDLATQAVASGELVGRPTGGNLGAVTPTQLNAIVGGTALSLAAPLFFAGATVIGLAATANDLAIGNVNRVHFTMSGPQALTGMVAASDGHMVIIINADSTDSLTLVHNSTSAVGNRFFCANNANVVIRPRGMVVAVKDQNLNNVWMVSAI